MRNLKKVLSLALALVMMLGMMVVGAGAVEYTDAGAIAADYKAAADVAGAINVIRGRTGNVFDPKTELTRAEGAAIIYRLIMSGIDKEPAATPTGFVDVDGTSIGSWAGGYIAACASQDIISGVDATHFAPEGKLSGYAFAKMLLVALGYNPDVQGYTGTSWSANVFRDAYTAGLTVSGLDMLANLTREQAAQMTLQALEATMVTQTGNITVNGVVISGSQPTKRTATGKGYDGETDGYLQLCELYFPKLKLDTDPNTTDDLGRPVNVWKLENKAIAKSAKSNVYATWTTEKKATDADVRDLDLASTVAVCKDGKADADVTGKSALVGLSGNGVRVELYANDDGEIIKAVVINTSLMKINRISTSSISLIKVAGVATNQTVADTNACFDTLAGMSKDDYVLVTVGESGVASVAVPEIVEGTVTKRTSSKITVDGTEYTFVKGLANSVNAGVDSEKVATIYVDADGFAYYGTSEVPVVAPSTTKYVYVVAPYTANDAWGASKKWFQGVLADGTVITGVVKANGVIEDPASPNTKTSVAIAGNLYEYEQDSSTKEYSLTNVKTASAAAGTAAATSNGTVKVAANATRLTAASNTRFSSEVNFIYVKGDGKDDLTVSTLAGVHAVVDSKIAWIGTENNAGTTLITTVFVIGASAPVESDDVVYLAATPGTISTSQISAVDGKTKLYPYTVYLNGEKVTAYSKDEAVGTAMGLYTYKIDEKTGAWTLGTSASPVVLAVGDVDYANNKYYVGTSDLDASGAIVVDTRTNPAVKVEDIGGLFDLNKKVGLTVYTVGNTADKTMDVIYIADTPAKISSGTQTQPTVSAGEKIDLGGSAVLKTDEIKAGAEITIKKLTNVQAVESGKAQEAVKLEEQTGSGGKTDMANAPVNVPVYSESKTNLKVGSDTNIAPKTMFLTYTGREYDGGANDIVLKITRDSDGTTAWTEKTTGTDKTSANGTFYVCLKTPTTDPGSAGSGAGFVAGEHYTVTITQVQNGKTVTLSTSGFTCPTLN